VTLDQINERLAAKDLRLIPAPASLPRWRGFFLVPREATTYPGGRGKEKSVTGYEPLTHFATLEEAVVSLLD
jgi:hypothetical protein